jgi:hypothetical protein
MSQQPTQQYGEQSPRSQQPQTGQQPTQIGQQPQLGQQPGQFDQQGAVQMGGTLEESISDEMRVALHDFVQAANVCEWCAEKCIDEGPEMAECIRLCRDVADLASLNAKLVARDSVFGPEVAEVFAQAAEACAEECARHPHKHCQECASVLPRAARATRSMLASFEGGQSPGLVPPRSGQI